MRANLSSYRNVIAYFIVSLISLSTSTQAQTIPLAWKQQIDAENASVLAKSMVVDSDGNIYLGGSFGDKLYAGSLSLSSITPPTTDIYVTKLDSAGNFLWAKSFASNGSDYLEGMTIDLNNNLVICGNTNGDSLTFDSLTIHRGNAGYYGYVAKLDPNGDCIFVTKLHSVATVSILSKTTVNAVTTDNAGNIFVTGGFRGDTLLADNLSLINQRPASQIVGSNIYLAMLSASGAVQWLVGNEPGTIPGANDAGLAISVDDAGKVFISGLFSGNQSVLGTETMGTYDLEEGFFASYNANGTFNWARAIRGSNPLSNTYDLVNQIITDNSGHLYIGGNYSGNELNFDSLAIFSTPSNPNGLKCFLFKLNAGDGSIIWSKIYGEGASAGLASLALNATKNQLAACINYVGSVDFDGLNPPSSTDLNGTLLLADTNGAFHHLLLFDGANLESMNNCTFDNDGLAIASGQYNGAFSNLGTQFTIQNQHVVNSFYSPVICKAAQQLTSLSNTEQLSAINLYPNPTTDLIQLAGEFESATIDIYAHDGKLLMHHQTKPHQTISLQHLPSGNYLLVVNVTNKQGVFKVGKW
jgi:hypothetical protein